MLHDKELERYNRQIILEEIGIEGQEKLNNARVLMVGAGGLGCPILQYLTAAGVGSIGIIDHDNVDVSNLQRQVLFRTRDIGKNKAQVAASLLSELNDNVDLKAYPVRLDESNVLSIYENYHIIIDGSDDYYTKYLINDACIQENKPMVYGAVHKHEGQISVFNHQHGPSYRCLFPDENKLGFGCSISGVMGVLPGVVGLYQANETIKIILGQGEVLSGKMRVLNLLNNLDYIVEFECREEQLEKARSRSINPNDHLNAYAS